MVAAELASLAAFTNDVEMGIVRETGGRRRFNDPGARWLW